MKKKIYGITYATIYGLTSEFDKETCGMQKLEIQFKGNNSPLPFFSFLIIKYYYESQYDSIISAFTDCGINEENKVAIIYEVDTGKIIAIGCNNFDRWLKPENLKVYSFSQLGIKNCSLIPVFY